MNKKKRGGCRQGHVGGCKRVISRVLLVEEGPIAATALPLRCRRLVYNPSRAPGLQPRERGNLAATCNRPCGSSMCVLAQADGVAGKYRLAVSVP